MINIIKNKLCIFFLCISFIINFLGCNANCDMNIVEFDTPVKEVQNEEIEYEKGTALPIGTVVSLKGKNEKLIIFGWMQMTPNNENKLYDYISFKYPIGPVTKDDIQVFDEENIDKIYFYGYEDKEGIEYRNKVIEYRNKVKNKNDEFVTQDNIVNKEENNVTVSSNQFLPLGSIVNLNNSDQKYMIIGRLIRDEEDRLYDYYSCLYPEGNIREDSNKLFDSDEIDTIYFYGYEDEEEINRNEELVKYKNTISQYK